jgi:hypothetical protein
MWERWVVTGGDPSTSNIEQVNTGLPHTTVAHFDHSTNMTMLCAMQGTGGRATEVILARRRWPSQRRLSASRMMPQTIFVTSLS